MRTALLLVTLLCATSRAQELPPPPPLPPPVVAPGPQPTAPAPRPSRESREGPDDLRTGVQFHADVGGSNAGMFGAISFGVGFNRVAILFTPQLSSTSPVIAIDLSLRIYLRQRQAGVLVGFLRPNGGVGAGASVVAGVGLGAGVEFLLTRNLGFTAELGLRLTGMVGLSPAVVSTVGTAGIMLHQ